MSRSQRGFSLLEMLVSLAIIGVVATASATLMASSLRAARNAAVLAKLKQNGDSATVAIERAMREGIQIVSPDAWNDESGIEDYDSYETCFTIRTKTGEQRSKKLYVESTSGKMSLIEYDDVNCLTRTDSSPPAQELLDIGIIVPEAFKISWLDSIYKRDRVLLKFILKDNETGMTRNFHVAAMLRNR